MARKHYNIKEADVNNTFDSEESADDKKQAGAELCQAKAQMS